MTYAKAKRLLQIDFKCLSLEELQKYSVSLLDAWREANAEYGMKQAVRNGFYTELMDFGGNGFTPKDYWLSKNLADRFANVQTRLSELYAAATGEHF